MKKIAVIGTGYVGLVSGVCFADVGNQVICCDINPTKISNLKKGIMPIYEPGLKELVVKNQEIGTLHFTTEVEMAIKEAEVIYIAVGTPMLVTGEADLSYLKQAARTIGENLNGYKVIVIKSTVPVGTGKLVKTIIGQYSQESFDLVSNPEFLREGTAIKDMMNMERAVIGGESDKAMALIEELHNPFTTKIVKANVETAELIKYAANAFLAVKISFINDIANICERVNGDVSLVSEGIGLDRRIGKSFLRAGVGYGGSCFPKDTEALLHIAKNCDYDFKLIKAAIETNEFQRQSIVEKVMAALGTLSGKTVSVLGLSFKPDTDDIRSSPALDIIPHLTKLGAQVKAYDPVATDEARKLLGDQCLYSKDLYETLRDADACLILTEWQDVKKLNFLKLKDLMKQPVIIDGRNLFNLEKMKALGLTYLSVGRPAVNQPSGALKTS